MTSFEARDAGSVDPEIFGQLLLRPSEPFPKFFDVNRFAHGGRMCITHNCCQGETHIDHVHNARMARRAKDEELPDQAKRLIEAREARGFENPTDAVVYFGWKYNSYIQHENGTRGLTKKRTKIYAPAFGVSEGWLLTGEGRGPKKSLDAGDAAESSSELTGIFGSLERDQGPLSDLGADAIRYALVWLNQVGKVPDEKIAEWAKLASQNCVNRLARIYLKNQENIRIRLEAEDRKGVGPPTRKSSPHSA